tara:strand:+ start:162 stop:344 length:183 start_codon:yes stop_codon:yes gene_type:complete
MKKTLLVKTMEDTLSKLIDRDNKKSNLVCIGKDKNGNKRYTAKSMSNKLYRKHLITNKKG